MIRLALVLAIAALLPAQNTLTPKEAAEGWLLLFDGESLFGWTRDGEAEWRVAEGAIAAEGGKGGLRTNAVFADYLLRCEFRSQAEAQSGIVLPGGYQLPAGAAKNARLGAGRWHVYEVNVSDRGFVVTLNGRRIATGKEGRNIVGEIGLAHAPGAKVEYRNVKLKPLGFKPIFNGKELAGWRKVERPNVKEPPEWSVRGGMIHVEKGPGQIETEGQWADFILQLDIRTNPQSPQHHPNSGVFFRGVPNGFWTGYEAQIRNEYKGEDRTQPVDFGTGAIYRYQAARKVVANDGEFFTMTVQANGRHLATWVNGYPVVDWTNPNPEGEDVRKKQAKLSRGTISLQAHDPTTNLDFRNLRLVELPRAPVP